MVKQETKEKSKFNVVQWGSRFIVIEQGETVNEEDEDMDLSLIGKIAICSKGIKGKITGRKMLSWGLSWVGVAVETGKPWASRNPTILGGRKQCSASRRSNI